MTRPTSKLRWPHSRIARSPLASGLLSLLLLGSLELPELAWSQAPVVEEGDGSFVLPDEKLPGDELPAEPSSDETIFMRDPTPSSAPVEEAGAANVPPVALDHLSLELSQNRVDTGLSFRGGSDASDRFYSGVGGVPQPLLIDLRPPLSAEDYKFRLGPLKLRFHVGTGLNVDHQSGGNGSTESDAYLILGFSGLVGDEELGRLVQFDYDAAAKVGSREGDIFHVDQSLSLSATWRMEKLRLDAGIYYASLSGTDREFNQGVNRSLVTISGSAHYAATEKTSYDFNLAVPIQDYGEGLSSLGVTSTNYFNYNITPKTMLGVGVAAGFIEVESSGSQTFEQALLRVVASPTALFSYSGTVGVDFRQTDAGLKVHPIFALGGTWLPRDGTSVSLVAERRVRNSVALEETDFTATSVTFGVSQRIGERFQVRPAVGYEFASYESIGQNDSRFSSRDDQTFFAQFGASVILFHNCSVAAAITYRDLDSTFSEQRNVQGSLQLTYQF